MSEPVAGYRFFDATRYVAGGAKSAFVGINRSNNIAIAIPLFLIVGAVALPIILFVALLELIAFPFLWERTGAFFEGLAVLCGAIVYIAFRILMERPDLLY